MSTVPVEEGKKGKGRPAYKGNPTATLNMLAFTHSHSRKPTP